MYVCVCVCIYDRDIYDRLTRVRIQFVAPQSILPFS